jgi:hypothetical protein
MNCFRCTVHQAEVAVAVEDTTEAGGLCWTI